MTAGFDNGETIAAFGFAEGTFKWLKTESAENHWRLPAAWKATVKDGKIEVWQIFADTKVPFDVIGKST